MSFSSYFSKQAKRPYGIFGRFIMPTFFNIGNSKLNKFVFDILSVEKNDRILEIGSGPGDLTNKILKKIDKGFVESVDFSKVMVSNSKKRNKSYIKKGIAKILEGNFNDIVYRDNEFDKICTVNTIYFWDKPRFTVEKIYRILNPKGRLLIGFEQNNQMKNNKLDDEVFNYYSPRDIEKILINAGFNDEVSTESIICGSTIMYCIVATK